MIAAHSDLVWHYTTGQCFRSIVESGVILPATACITPGERPITWFSSNQTWERTSTKTILTRSPGLVDGAPTMRTATFDETRVLGGGLVRIGVTRHVARHDWSALQAKGRIPTAIVHSLERVAYERGADPAEWFGCFAPVPREKWSAVDVYENGAWVRIRLGKPERAEERAA